LENVPHLIDWLVPAVGLAVTLFAAAHVVLHKRDSRAAIGWVGLIVLSPFVGSLIYYLFGINRIRRRAVRLAAVSERRANRPTKGTARPGPETALDAAPEALHVLARAVRRVTRAPLTFGNSIDCLVDGTETYPAMLREIERAEHSIGLASYIFDNDRAGTMFVEALAQAVARGIEVRVLIDAVGARYSRPRVTRVLASRGVRVAEFLPSRLPWRNPYVNLRNHRKLLVIDHRVGFAGGVNIREGCLVELDPPHPVRDVHFRFAGPVVEQLFRPFREDWAFTTGEPLDGEAWASRVAPAGRVPARGILDGPDEDFETIRWTKLAALDSARNRVRIVTPYFLPDAGIVTALRLAALRGVEVDVLIPERNNLRWVEWATMAQLGEILESGCRVWLTPRPFDHGKIMVVDDHWSLVGSANWDPRSLRLNFELDVELYGREAAEPLAGLADARLAASRRLGIDEVRARSLPRKLRDGVARLFSPYL
jgi:cardiolipin synthase